jgi:signal transduction histidine kinase
VKKQLPQILPYLMLALLVGLGLAGTIVVFRLRPPVNEMVTLLVLLSTTGVVSLLAARLAHRTGLLNRFGSVRWMLFASYGLAVGLILLNVWVMAKLMLVSQHYLRLASMVLGFSAVIAMGFGYVLSATVSGAVNELVNGANTLAEGDLSARVPVTGSNELSELARAFNEMAGRLAAMAEQEREMEQARRDLITWVSHDLRTPLTSLQVMIEALADGVASDEETISRYLRTSMNELRALRGLIDDLFELARFDAGHLQIDREMSSLHDLVSDTLESLRAQAERKQLTLSGEVASDVDPVWMAPDKIQRVLSNLIGNAIRYTPPGGAVHLKARREDGQVTVSVRDNGPGIPEKDLPHVFEPFLRGEEARTRDLQEQGSDFDRGVGLGLAIAKAFVEAHAGTIEVESEEGAGSEFRFSVPRLPPSDT